MTSPTDDEGLTGQQLHAMQKRLGEILQQRTDNAELRRTILQMAASACEGNPEVLVPLAREMLQFVVEPYSEVIVSIEVPK